MRSVTLPGNCVVIGVASGSEPSEPQTKNELSALKLFALVALLVEIPPLPIVTTEFELTLLDCFCSRHESLSRPIPATLL